MAESSHYKRKSAPGGANGAPPKRSRGGNSGRWQTPHQKEKQAQKVELGKTLELGDQGIWVTYARGMRSKAVREFQVLCEEYGKEMYGLKSAEEEDKASGDNMETEDIAMSIAHELENLKKPQKPETRKYFTPIGTNMECVFFMKTMAPVEPDKLTLRICGDTLKCKNIMQRKCKYVNRLSPVVNTERATEKGLEKVARSILGDCLELVPEKDETGQEVKPAESSKAADAPPSSYAIRQNVRNHDHFKSSEIIQRIASVVGPKHKVDLTSPDKVIIVEVFQLFCGMSIVDGKQWEDMKRYNMNELYKLAAEQSTGSPPDGEDDGSSSK